jgi:hypothetical protein
MSSSVHTASIFICTSSQSIQCYQQVQACKWFLQGKTSCTKPIALNRITCSPPTCLSSRRSGSSALHAVDYDYSRQGTPCLLAGASGCAILGRWGKSSYPKLLKSVRKRFFWSPLSCYAVAVAGSCVLVLALARQRYALWITQGACLQPKCIQSTSWWL